MNLCYECPECGQELEGDFGESVTCSVCGLEFETDWDYVGEGIACWIIGEGKEVNNDESTSS